MCMHVRVRVPFDSSFITVVIYNYGNGNEKISKNKIPGEKKKISIF